MRLAVILLCLVLFSSHLASGMFARYIASSEFDDAAQVAKIDLKVVEIEQLSVDSMGNGTYKFIVKNDSQVAFDYDVLVYITYPDNSWSRLFDSERISDALSDVKLNGETGTLSDNKLKYTFSGYDSLSPDSESAEFVLTFKAFDISAASPGASGVVGNAAFPIGLNVTAKGTQVD